MLRCAASFVVAAYVQSTHHSSGFARLACGAFYEAVFFGFIKFEILEGE
jgi:hypothetical protein